MLHKLFYKCCAHLHKQMLKLVLLDSQNAKTFLKIIEINCPLVR